MPFVVTWMDLETVIHMKSEKDNIISLIYIQNQEKKNSTNELTHKTEAELQMQKTNLRLLRGRINWKFGINIYTLLLYKDN